MCDPATLIALASAAATAGGAVMTNQAQKSSAKQYNNQVTQQNNLLQQQFQDRQEKINNARDAQARVFQQTADLQDQENARQTQMLQEKAKAFQEAAAQPEVGAKSPVIDNSMNSRLSAFAAEPTQIAADYGLSSTAGGGSSEDRILRDHAAGAEAAQSARSSGIVAALSRMGATQDAASKQGQLFTDIGRGINDAGLEADASSRLLDSKLRAPDYKMNSLGQVIGEQVSTPYFRGQEPWARPADTTAGDVLGGLGQIGLNSYFMGAGTPKTKAVQTKAAPVKVFA